MKYFTKEWCSGKLEDNKVKEIKRDYWNYIDIINESLPFSLKFLANNINLHDGIINKASYSSEKNSLSIVGIFGDLQVGYFNLEIRYLNIYKLEKDTLTSIFKGQKLEVLSDEVELISKNLYSHRLLFLSKKEVEIFFSNIEIKVSAASPDDYKKKICQLKFE
jgi:hypothetical protein